MAGNRVFNNADLLEKIIHSESKRKVAGVNKECCLAASKLYDSSDSWEDRYVSEMIQLQERDVANNIFLAAILIIMVVLEIIMVVALGYAA